MLEIQTSSPQAGQWKAESYRQIVNEELGLAVTVAEVGEEVIGFLIYRSLGAGEVEILNLAVAAEHRRRGFGRDLVGQLLSQTRSVFLEVRASNAGAISFYRQLGFSEIGRREGYYAIPREDGVQMRFQDLQGASSPPPG